MSPFTMMAGMMAVLAMVTMTIATVGLYGLIAYGVSQRTREIGIRIALGARPRDILAHVGAGALRLTMIGIVFGVVGAALFARLLVVMLYGVSPSDPRTYVGVSLGLLAVALMAAWVPSKTPRLTMISLPVPFSSAGVPKTRTVKPSSSA